MRGGLESALAGRTCRRWRAGLVLAAVLAVAGTAGSAAAAEPEPPIPSGLLGITPSVQVNALDMQRMVGAGATTLRHGLSWTAMQPRQDRPIDFTKSDEFMVDASEIGLSIDLLLSTTPKWARSSPEASQWEPPLSSPAARDGWRRFAEAVAERYGHGGTFWEEHPELTYRPVAWTIWNEPNLDGFWGGPNSPRGFAELVNIAGSALHRVDPGGTVVTGGVFCGFRWKRFVERFYDFVAKSSFDAVAFHPYAESPYKSFHLMLEGREIMDHAGDKRTAYWVDEISWGTEVGRHRFTGTPAQQAQKMQTLFQILVYQRECLSLEKILWYGIRDDPEANVCQFCASSGLWKAGGLTPKPAWSVFKGYGSAAAGTIRGRVRTSSGGQAGERLYLDLNGNRSRDGGEPRTTTNTQGKYSFARLLPARYALRVTPGGGERCRRPDNCARKVGVEEGQVAANKNFRLAVRG